MHPLYHLPRSAPGISCKFQKIYIFRKHTTSIFLNIIVESLLACAIDTFSGTLLLVFTRWLV